MFPLLEPECFDSFNSVTFYFTKSDLEKVKYQKKTYVISRKQILSDSFPNKEFPLINERIYLKNRI